MVEWGGLENRCTLSSTGGSNPFLSATKNGEALLHHFLFSAPVECLHSNQAAENKNENAAEQVFCFFVARSPAAAQGICNPFHSINACIQTKPQKTKMKTQRSKFSVFFVARTPAAAQGICNPFLNC